MKVIEYFSSDNKEHWLEEIGKSDWSAGAYLHDLLRDEKLHELIGENALVLLLTDGDRLVSFCTFASMDEIQPTELSPWVGFVYTFPEYRGHRYFGQILDWCESVAAKAQCLFIKKHGKEAFSASRIIFTKNTPSRKSRKFWGTKSKAH